MPDADTLRWHRMQRAILGVMALVLGAGALWLNLIDKAAGERYPMFAAGCLRMAPVMFVLWLALPEARRGWKAWLFLGAVLVAGSLMFRQGKRGLLVLIPALSILFALGFLRRFTAGAEPPRRERR